MKTKTLLFLAVLSISSAIGQISTNGLIAWYPFNGSAIDASGNGNNGIITGATLTADRFGNANSAYSFNGSSVITIPSSSSFQSLTDSFSISVWTNMSSYNAHGQFPIIDKDTACAPTAGTTPFLVMSDTISDRGYSIDAINCGVSAVWAVAGVKPSFNSWTNTVYTYDGANIKIYVNGVLSSTTPFTGNIPNKNSPITIGHTVFGPGNSWAYGNIDDIRIYDRAVDSSEVNALYNENICYQMVTVTDTLIINTNISGYNPITYTNTIKVYPNPTKTSITINAGTSGVNTGYQIKILNTLSQVVYQQTISTSTYVVNLSTFGGAGVYFVQLYDTKNNLIDIRKIVLE